MGTDEKMRLDVALTVRQLAQSREKAREMITAGFVTVNGKTAQKASQTVQAADELRVIQQLPFVSRGGYKLQKALEHFSVSLQDAVCLDVGASTGGFTDCMLQHGARKVYALDVGSGQLDEKLRQDPRVCDMENTNIRDLSPIALGEPADFISVDVSFISLALVLPVLPAFLREGGTAVCLVKPQFEAGREFLGKNGIVKDKKVHLRVLEQTMAVAMQAGFSVLGATYSPVKGTQGNVEYLLYLQKDEQPRCAVQNVRQIVEDSHREL